MSSWFTINLGDAMLAGDSLEHIKSLFLLEYKKAKDSKDMAVFVRHESKGHLHCELKIYFSPRSVKVAKVLNGTPCTKPSLNDLALLAGSEESWPIFFPKKII